MLDTTPKFARTWWQHTDKGIRRGEPADRRFAVVGYDTVEKCLVAWKITYIDDRTFLHPAYGRCISVQEKWLQETSHKEIDPFILESSNRSMPTAMFNPDSLYCLCV